MRTSLLTMLVLVGCGAPKSEWPQNPMTARAAVLSCPASPAKQVFGAAMCLCGDYRAVGEGAWVEGGAAQLNGILDVVGTHHFSGDVIAYGGVSGVGALDVGGNLFTNGRVEGVGDVTVNGDLAAASGVSGVGQLAVKGTLRTPEADAWTGTAKLGAKGGVAPLPGPPCACGAEQRLDLAALMATAIERNDNPAAGLSLHEHVGDHQVTLGSGSYVFDGMQTVGAHTVTIDGAVAMYVKGDFQAVGKTGLKLTPGSTLDLYVDGDVTLVGDSSFGEGASPGSVRVYVAGERELSFVGGQRVVGSLYAPLSDLELVGASAFDGSLFVRNVEGVGSLEVRAGGQMVATPDSELCRAQPVLKGIE
ncbi:MAG: hypothetical protein JNM69_05105 [Archangium sp.]|nr:hypothetical protein [Archangium sp.]